MLVNNDASLTFGTTFVNKATIESQKSNILDSISLDDILELIKVLVKFILAKKRTKIKGLSGDFCLFIKVICGFCFMKKIEYLPP